MITYSIVPRFQSTCLATNTDTANNCFAERKKKKQKTENKKQTLRENESIIFEWVRADDIFFPSWPHPKGSWMLSGGGSPSLPQERISVEGDELQACKVTEPFYRNLRKLEYWVKDGLSFQMNYDTLAYGRFIFFWYSFVICDLSPLQFYFFSYPGISRQYLPLFQIHRRLSRIWNLIVY